MMSTLSFFFQFGPDFRSAAPPAQWKLSIHCIVYRTYLACNINHVTHWLAFNREVKCFEAEIISLVELNLSEFSQNCSSGQLFGAQSKTKGVSKQEAHIMQPHVFTHNRKHASLLFGSADLWGSWMPRLWKSVITIYIIHCNNILTTAPANLRSKNLSIRRS